MDNTTRTCCCGKTFTPRKRTQTHCTDPCMARGCPVCDGGSGPKRQERDALIREQLEEEHQLGSAEQRFAQMDELFRGYEDVPPIVIDRMDEGARVVILSDTQIPFEERWLVAGTVGRKGAVERFLKDFAPDLLIYNGDILDCYSISDFKKSPNRKFTIQQEKQLATRMLDSHREILPANASMIFIDGNHEYRLWRALCDIAMKDERAREILEALDVTSLTSEHLLGLGERDIEWQPYSGHVDLLGFMVTHGDRVSQFSSYTARRMSDRYRTSGASGHTHRLGAYHYTGAGGRTHAWYESGCLCRMDPEYVSNPNWQQGFLYGVVSNNKLHIQTANVFDNRFYVPGLGIYAA